MVKNPPVNGGETRDACLIRGLGRSPGEGNGNPLHYYCLENSTDRGVWRATVHRATKSQTEHMNVYGGSGTELRSHMHYIVTTIIPGENNYYYAHLIGEERGLENF